MSTVDYDLCANHKYYTYPDPDANDYATIDPFPHIVVKDAWDVQLLLSCKREISHFSSWDGEKDFYGSKKKRFCGNIEVLPSAVVRLIHEAGSPSFLRWLEKLTGEPSLLPDPYLEGAGIHQIVTGGFLKVHADFNWNRQLNLYRRLNVLIYLNDNWNPAWGGHLELWKTDMSQCAKAIAPELNTMVVFTTDDKSFHGHPHPLGCPENVTRDSIALYYYSSLQPKINYSQKRNSTDYRLVNGEKMLDPKTSLSARIKEKLRAVIK